MQLTVKVQVLVEAAEAVSRDIVRFIHIMHQHSQPQEQILEDVKCIVNHLILA